jgi:DNA glycosylase AlkZ-like
MTPLDVAQRRLRNERLVGPAFAAPADVVSWLGAVQSQDYGGAKWAVAQRARGCSDADVEEACDRGDIVRTHVMRPTWHFVTSADARWMLELTAPRVHAANAYYYRQLELDERVFTKSHAALAAALRGGRHLTRVELGHALERAGIRAAGTRLAYVLMRAELDAVICSGPRRGKQFTYALFDERVPASKPLARDQALAELVRRYFASHGPATVQDFAWWSGLTVADGTKGIDLAKASHHAAPRPEKTDDSPPSELRRVPRRLQGPRAVVRSGRACDVRSTRQLLVEPHRRPERARDRGVAAHARQGNGVDRNEAPGAARCRRNERACPSGRTLRPVSGPRGETDDSTRARSW